MTDHAKRQQYLDECSPGGMSNRKAVTLMLLALVVPQFLISMIG